LIKQGERVTVMAFGYSETQLNPKILLLDECNRIIRAAQ
jgi:aspartate 1-decarboxylase